MPHKINQYPNEIIACHYFIRIYQ